MAQTPRIVESPLTRPSRWYVLTRYTEKRGIDAKTGERTAYLVASVKHDVTDQMRAILKAKTRAAHRRKGGDGV